MPVRQPCRRWAIWVTTRIWAPVRCAGSSNNSVEDPLSDALLSGDFEDGDVVLVDLAEGDEIVLKKEGQDLIEPELEPSKS